MNASVDTLAEQANPQRRVEGAIRSTQQAAHQAVDQLADGAERLAANTDRLAHRSADKLRDRADQLRERARHTADGAIVQIRQRPLKAVLIAGAVGAALGMLFTLFGRTRA
jgi:ElaB/YqjD/DUF883 family membrane-anchored ribosome-binding protein